MYDIKSLQDALNTNVSNTVTTGLQDQLNKIIAWIVIPTLVLTVAIIVIYVVHMLRRRKIENAILEIRDILREIKLDQIASKPRPDTPPTAPQAISEQSDEPPTSLAQL